jgi:NADH dehydrogenase FAD-containing subunit
MEFPEAARRMCREWLAAHSCILRPGIKVDVSSLTATATGQQVAIKNSKEHLEADIIVLCLGSDGGTPEFITHSQGLTAMVDAHGRLPVNDQFQLLAHANIYVCGDCCSHPSVSTKTAQMANWGGIQVAQSIAQALAPTTLLTRARVAMRWPALLLRNPRSWPSLYVVSLGPHHGLLIVNGFVLPTAFGQRVASFAKDFIEASKVMESQGSWLGLVLWQLGDSAACMVDFLGL